MSLSEGMDLARVREVAGQIRGSAQTVGDVRQQGDGQLVTLHGAWSGPDLEDFDTGWRAQSPALERMAEALRQAADDLLRQAEQQEDASGGVGDAGDGGWSGRQGEEPWWRRFADKDFGKDILGVDAQAEADDGDDDDDGNLFSRAKDKLGDVKDSAEDAVDSAKDKAGDVVDGVKDTAEDVKDFGMDRVDDAKDFGKDVIDTAKDTAGDVKDGLVWLGGQAKDGLSWLGGQAKDGLSWIGEQAKAVAADLAQWLEGIGDGYIRYLEAQVNLLGQFTQIFTDGRFPRVSEVVAGLILVRGSLEGVLINALTGKDQHIFDDGHGVAGDSTQLSEDADSNPDGHAELRPPTSIAELVRTTTDAYAPDDGNVRVTEVTKDGKTSYIVSVPGTEPWDPAAGENPLDVTGNFAGVGNHGDKTAAMEAVEDAMSEAGIPSGAPVLLVGHSQGGIVTNALLSDSTFADTYNVTHSITLGAPVDNFDIPDDVQALNLQHRNDVVPRVDLGDKLPGLPNVDQQLFGNGPNETRVVLDSPGGPFSFERNHSHVEYGNSVEQIQRTDPRFLAYQDGLDDFLVDPERKDGATVRGEDIEIRREFD